MSVDSDPRCEQVSSNTLSSTTPASNLPSDETIPISTISMTTTTSTTVVPTAMMPTIIATSTLLSASTEAIPATKQSCDDCKYVQQMSYNQMMSKPLETIAIIGCISIMKSKDNNYYNVQCCKQAQGHRLKSFLLHSLCALLQEEVTFKMYCIS